MRGCLSAIAIALVFVTALIWFGGPPLASAVVSAALTVSSRLSVGRDGSVVALADGASIGLFAPNPSLPLHMTSLAVRSSGLDLRGTLDVGAMLR